MEIKGRKVKNKDYSMHLLPIDFNTKTVLGAFEVHETEDTDAGLVNVPAITTNGRISFLPIGDSDSYVRMQDAIVKRIEERYPKESYPNICIYVCAAVVLTGEDAESMRFAFEVWGFTEPMPELDEIYQLLVKVGQDPNCRFEVAEFLKSKPIKSYVNALIDFLKKEMNWEEYVSQAKNTASL